MARFARAVAVGVAHHITQRGVDRSRIFFHDADRRTYLECLATYCAQARARVLAYCLMGNHVHLVAIPEEPESLAVALRRTHSRYALYLNARRHRVGHLWQNRFYSCALDEPHLRAALRYVERNPVRAQLVAKAEDYKWSSAAAHLDPGSGPSLLDWEFHQRIGGRKAWTALLAEPEQLDVTRALQRGTFTGRPVGDPEFLARLEHDLGRPLSSRQHQPTCTTSSAAGS